MSETTLPDPSPRMLPPLTPENRAFWTGGSEGSLLITRCGACRRWVHPPGDACTDCRGKLVPEVVSGRGTLFTFTVNHQAFRPEVPPPYVIAIVELVEQPDLRLPANILHCEPDDLHCGMEVRVVFEQQGEHFVPCFEPA